MDKTDINKLKEELDKASLQYYNEGESFLTDGQFDEKMKLYEKLSGKEYNTLTEPPKDKRQVNVDHSFEELVGRMSKQYNIEDLREWFINKFSVGNKSDILNAGILLSYKKDGNSVTGTFNKDGKLIQMLTRGKDGKGMDLTDFFDDRSIDPSLFKEHLDVFNDDEDLLGIKFEAVITYEDFNKVNQLFPDKNYSNPRNLVAGILRSDDGYKLKHLIKLAPLRMINKNRTFSRLEDINFIDEFLTGESKLNTPSDLGLFLIEERNLDKVIETIEDVYNKIINEERDNLDYMIDGLVIEILDEDARIELGRTNDVNNFDTALKFPNLTQKSKIKDIEFYIAKTGRITPVSVFEPVYFNGAKCDHVSLSNYDRFNELKLGVGSNIIVEYHGDVLSYVILDPEKEKENSTIEPIPFIQECPRCGSPVKINENKTFAFCSNDECPSKVGGKLVNWTTKLGLKGINSSTINKLVEGNLVETIPDLYSVDLEEAKELGIFGDKSAENFKKSINMRKEIFDYELFGSLLFEGVGRGRCKEINKVIPYSKIMKLSEENKYNKLKGMISEIPGFNLITAESFINGLKNNLDTIHKISQILSIKEYKGEIKVNSNVEPKKIVFTGFRDPELKEKLELEGHKITGKASKKTDIVIAKDVTSNSSSVKIAKENGIELLTVEEFKSKYNY